MNRVLAYLIRFFMIVLGYAVASLAASAFLSIVMLGWLASASEVRAAAQESLVFTIPFGALFVAYFAFVPSAVAILAGEILGKRDWLIHALGGAVVAGVAIGFVRGSDWTGGPAVNEVNVALAMIGAGMCGGIGYWAVAGRGAGGRRLREEEPTAPAP